MNKLALGLLTLGVLAALPAQAANSVRISQVYGGAGGATAFWNQDYVELFNASTSPVDMSGWSLLYGSASAGSGFSFGPQFPSGSIIPACGYFLIGLSEGPAGLVVIPSPDLTFGGLNMSQSSGKLLLINAPPALVPCLGDVNPQPATWIDVVGYGSGATICFETAAAPGVTTTTTILRGLDGLIDTDDNSADFVAVTSAIGQPRNSLSQPNPACPSGACCGTDGSCSFTTAALCAAAGGVYLGDQTTCPNPDCLVTPVTRNTWGKVKSTYR